MGSIFGSYLPLGLHVLPIDKPLMALNRELWKHLS